ncbi:hypothetical protein [Kitasatospora sp. NPDC097643]|uniref:hypothetical protein n=1 Tax=Kitasatospora sp. NPDC097643 TaxID=3157230 RepID=UPI00331C2618
MDDMAWRGSDRSRLAIFASIVVAVVCVSACTSSQSTARPTAASTRAAEVRQDVEPLKRRFPQLGELSAARWVGQALGGAAETNPRLDVPGPTDVALDGIAWIESGVMATITATGEWHEESIACDVPNVIATEIGSTKAWLHSDSFDREVTRSQYSGSFYFEKQGNRVYFCTVNPKLRID